MKIVAICGSPRKGKTHAMLSSMKENHPEADIEIIMLHKQNIQMCKGCYACVLVGEAHCPLQDDRDTVIEKIIAADGVIFASPVYVNHVTGMMKNLFDRIGYFAHRPRFFDKYAMVMSVCGGFGTEPTNKYMSDILSSFGFNVVSSLELQMSTMSEKEQAMNQKKANAALDELVTGIKSSEKKQPSLMNLIMFNLFKYISTVEKDMFKADHQYYKDKERFPYDGKISFYKKLISKQVVRKFAKELESVG